jgi:hypothetical protein
VARLSWPVSTGGKSVPFPFRRGIIRSRFPIFQGASAITCGKLNEVPVNKGPSARQANGLLRLDIWRS